ncbi:hypothetical protein [Sphingobacterium hungaricum]|uniref:Uncharacterized protein n=1 Tax=Sphingobacterium hungaricum TaxID=2082723 RepID=A0A928V0P8_9SPHI|nr:hypothetical protein [Sphingobacterium hungaricum]MBE8714965.1 hypothetical protein [Sphingobacterium hungaricum]
MKRLILLSFILLHATNLVFGQKIFVNKEYEFAMQEPDNWIEVSNEGLISNLKNLELTEESLSKLISDSKGSLLLTSYYKYNPQTHPGLIPTIQVNVRAKGNTTFEQFKRSMAESTESFKNYFPDFELIKDITEVEVSGIKSIYFVAKFSMNTQDGQEVKVRSRGYAIPYKNYFFQINFTDGQVGEDCTSEFDQILKTIKIGDQK